MCQRLSLPLCATGPRTVSLVCSAWPFWCLPTGTVQVTQTPESEAAPGGSCCPQALGGPLPADRDHGEAPAPGRPHSGGSQPSCEGTRASRSRPSGLVREGSVGWVCARAAIRLAFGPISRLAGQLFSKTWLGCFEILFFQRQKFLGL